jgi:hypothetical protein
MPCAERGRPSAAPPQCIRPLQPSPAPPRSPRRPAAIAWPPHSPGQRAATAPQITASASLPRNLLCQHVIPSPFRCRNQPGWCGGLLRQAGGRPGWTGKRSTAAHLCQEAVAPVRSSAGPVRVCHGPARPECRGGPGAAERRRHQRGHGARAGRLHSLVGPGQRPPSLPAG